MEHVVIGLGEIHRPHNWEWADATARANEVVTDTTLLNCFGLQLSDNSLWRLSAAAPAVWTSVAGGGSIGSIASADGTITVTTTGSAVDLSVPVTGSTTNIVVQVRNTTGATLTKGTVVYISGATGQIPTVSKALATSDATSAQTLGMLSANLANNANGYVTITGGLTGMNTSAFADGAQLYLSGTTAGTYTSTKTLAPTHLVYVGVVEYSHATQGKIFVKVQNGYEMDELHNVSAVSPTNGQTLVYNTSTSLWESTSLTYSSLTGTVPTWNQNTTGNASNVTGIVAIANGGTGTTTPGIVAGTNVTVSGTWPNQTINATGGGSGMVYPGAGIPNSSGSAWSTSYTTSGTGTVLALAASPTFVTPILGTPISGNFSTGTFTWPTLNQNTTGTAANVTGTIAIANGGTGQTTASAGFNALSPITTTGDLIIGNGAASATRLAIGTNGYVLTSNGTTASWAAASGGGSGTVTSITAGTGLTGGAITTSGTIALATTAVTAASYTSANITVDAYGRITAASNGSGGSGITTGKSIAMAMIFGY